MMKFNIFVETEEHMYSYLNANFSYKNDVVTIGWLEDGRLVYKRFLMEDIEKLEIAKE